MNKQYLSGCLSTIFLVVTIGCGQSTTVTGTVTYEGKPLKRGNISFVPVDGQGPSCGTTIIDGKYKLELTPGKKIVNILDTTPPDHIPTREELESQAKKPTEPDDNRMPPNAKGNGAQVDVHVGNQTLNFALTRPN